MGIIIKRPIAMGMWGTGAPTHGNYTYEAYVERVQAMQQAGPVPAAPDDPIELALGFLFAHSEPDTAIVATMNLSHLQTNIELMERGVSLATETLAELYRRYDQHRWRQIT